MNHSQSDNRNTIARIGPNSILRITEVLNAKIGAEKTRQLYTKAGLESYLITPPEQMVDERDVTQLHQTLRSELGIDKAREISWDAGLLTGDYLLGNRIPALIQALLRRLPATLASRVLLKAIDKNAWTFTGSGTFAVTTNKPIHIFIENNPLCRGANTEDVVCDYYAATFERLFKVLVHPASCVREIECEAAGAKRCVFEVSW